MKPGESRKGNVPRGKSWYVRYADKNRATVHQRCFRRDVRA